MTDKDYHDMTLIECREFGRSVLERCTGAFEVDGRIITNVEMSAVVRYRQSETYKQSERRKAKKFLENEL
jgi:hypothetical protein